MNGNLLPFFVINDKKTNRISFKRPRIDKPCNEFIIPENLGKMVLQRYMAANSS